MNDSRVFLQVRPVCRRVDVAECMENLLHGATDRAAAAGRRTPALACVRPGARSGGQGGRGRFHDLGAEVQAGRSAGVDVVHVGAAVDVAVAVEESDHAVVVVDGGRAVECGAVLGRWHRCGDAGAAASAGEGVGRAAGDGAAGGDAVRDRLLLGRLRAGGVVVPGFEEPVLCTGRCLPRSRSRRTRGGR